MKRTFNFAMMLYISTTVIALAQSVITFESTLGRRLSSYYEKGIGFQVVPPTAPYNDYIIVADAGYYSNVPYNGTKYIYFEAVYLNHVSISLTNGGAFGLSTVDLSPKIAAAPGHSITFNGYRADETMVTTTFTTPTPGTHDFQTYVFGSEFSSGLTRVEIPTSSWAMDNLVIVPEPGTTGLMVVGIMAFAGLVKRKRHQCTKTTAT